MEIRTAVPGDLAALTEIYNHYVTNSHVTFDVNPFKPEQRRGWFDQYAGGRHRLLVAVDEGVLGYAASGPWRPKPAYGTTVELSVYCAPTALRRGVGRLLCERLFGDLAGEDLHRAVGGAALPNPGSEALLSRLGFRPVGVFTQVGRKFDRYWDVAWFEKSLR